MKLRIVLGVLVTMALIAPIAQQGMAVTPDGVRYVAAAENLLAGKGYSSFDGTTAAGFAPVYPVTLALFRFFVQRTNALLIVAALSLCATFLFAGMILRRLGAPEWQSLLGAALVAISPPIWAAASSALSEGLFVALALAYVYSVMRKSRGWLIASALLGVAVCLTRFAGVGLVIGTMVTMQGKRWLAAIPGLLVTGLWFTLMGAGHNRPVPHNPLPALTEMANGYWVWLGAALPLGLWLAWHRSRALFWTTIGLAVAVVGGCLLMDMGQAGTRQIIPVLTLLTLGVFSARNKPNRLMAAFLAGFLLVGSALFMATRNDSSLAFNSKTWRKSAAMNLLKQTPDSLIYSNAWDGVWYNFGRQTNQLPRFDTPFDNKFYAGRPMDGRAIAIWFNYPARPYYGSPQYYKQRIAADTVVADAYIAALVAK